MCTRRRDSACVYTSNNKTILYTVVKNNIWKKYKTLKIVVKTRVKRF